MLHGPFDIELHRRTFIDYFEVMLDTEGAVYYALPSHQEFLIGRAMERNHWTREELEAACPQEMYGSFLEWMISQSGGYIPVWKNFVLNYPLNEKQIATLKKLKMEGLFCGEIPEPEA